MEFDATFWVAVSFVIFFGALIYFKIPQNVNNLLGKMIVDIKNEIDESEKLRTESKKLLDNSQSKLNSVSVETKKILDPKIKLTATCVRVPVMVSHAESINVEFEKSFDIEKVKNILNKADGCRVLDERKNGGYVTPLEAENSYITFISRIRKDGSNDKALNMWVVSDNLLKGAALNTVQIAEKLIKNFYGK